MDSNLDKTRPGWGRLDLIILGIAAVWFSALANLGLATSDEGFYFARAWELTQGKMIFRDYYSHTAPLGFMIQAALMEGFGFSLMAGRVYGVIQALIMVAVVLRMMRRRLNSPLYFIPAVLFFPYSIALSGFPHYNIDTIFFFILSLAAIDRYLTHPRPGWIFWAAFCGALATGCKQTAAAVAIPTVLLALGLARSWFRDRRVVPELLAATLGFCLPFLLIIAYLAWGHALQEAWQCLTGTGGTRGVVLNLILPRALAAFVAGAVALRGLAEMGKRRPRLSAPLWAGALLAGVGLAVFAPWQISSSLLCGVIALSLLLWVKPDRDEHWSFWITLRCFGLLMFFTGLLSNVDFAHMIFSATGGIFMAAPLAGRLWRDRKEAAGKALAAVGAAGLVCLLGAGVYLDFNLLDLYFHTGPRWKDTTEINLPGARCIKTTPGNARELEQTVEWIKAHTAPDEKIFAYPWDCLFYPLSGRLSASYYTFILYDSINRQGVERMIADLERNRTRVIVVEMEGNQIKHVVFDDLKSVIDPYLKSHFEPVARFGRYQIMTRKGQAG